MKTPNQTRRSRLLFLANSTLALVVSSSSAGDLAYNLKPWGYEDPRAIPWKYKPGDGVHEFINGRLQFFIITDVEWDDINKTPKYKKVLDFRMKL
jgi:hypothetical protein